MKCEKYKQTLIEHKLGCLKCKTNATDMLSPILKAQRKSWALMECFLNFHPLFIFNSSFCLLPNAWRNDSWSGEQAPALRCKKYHRSCPIDTLWSESACWEKIMQPHTETLSDFISVSRGVLGAAGICRVAEANTSVQRAFVHSF